MASDVQRVWSRVEAPGTARGHALVASFGRKRWTAWENADGSWSLRYGEGTPVKVAEWADARRIAETLRTRGPEGRLPNPINPHIVNAAAMGAMIGGRAPPLSNPQEQVKAAHDTVRALIPSEWLAGGCRLAPSGNLQITVHRGYAAPTALRFRSARVPFAVDIQEV